MDRVRGDAERRKTGVRPDTFSLCDWSVEVFSSDLVPVIVTVDIPVAAVLLAVSVKVLIVLVGVVGFVLNDAVTPFGRPDAAKEIGRASWRKGGRVMVLEPLDQ